MTNYPWPMDKPIEEFSRELSHSWANNEDLSRHIDYLLARLKLAEGERDSLIEQMAGEDW